MIVREYHLRRRPTGAPSADDLVVETKTLPSLNEGQVMVRNLFLSVDPYMRGRMSDAKSYVASYGLGTPLDGGAIGRIVESRSPAFATGDLVLSTRGWREGFVDDAKGLFKIDPTIAPPSSYLGTLGMPGLTAYVGLLDVGRLAEGETVLVSGAAGAVGMVVCQIAKLKQCRVIAVVGSDAKARWLLDHAKVDAAINYRTTPKLRAAIREAAPDGIDLTFENVGGEQLEAALGCSKDFARVVVCGLISQYNVAESGATSWGGGGPRNFREVLVKRLTVKGFIVTDHFKRQREFLADMAGWIKAGKIHWTETTIDGFERMPEAFAGLFEGKNLGKMVVRLGDA